MIKLNPRHIASSIANWPDDDGLYEICGTQYPCLEENEDKNSNTDSREFNIQNNDLNTSQNTVNQCNSK